ncbi:MAG: hypothetical protein LBD54_02180 [Puniceicoccales bacterium]|jgi:hypothetical protein|nr:hypothetical protein [Puniceicoccales bacterium]
MIIRHYQLDADEASWTPGAREAYNFAIAITGKKKPKVPFLYEEIVFHDTDPSQKVFYDPLPFQKAFRAPLEECDLVVRFGGLHPVRFAQDYDWDSQGPHARKFPNGFVLKPVFYASSRHEACRVAVTPPITYISLCCAYRQEPRAFSSLAIIIHRVLENGVPLKVPYREFQSKQEMGEVGRGLLHTLKSRLRRKKRH